MDPVPEPYVPPPCVAPNKEIIKLRLGDPFRWLALGWHDLLAAKGIGIFYGVCFLAMALVLVLMVLELLWGLLFIGPWLGHASWHAYRSSVRWLDEDAVAVAW